MTTKLTMTWPCFEWQVKATRAFYHSGLRRFVWVIARQLGKTSLLEAVCIREALVGKRIGYFAPSYDRSEEVYNECVEALSEDAWEERDGKKVHIQGPLTANLATHKQLKAGWIIRFDRRLCRGVAKALGLPNADHLRGGSIIFKSLGNKEMLRGETLNGILEDEAGLVEGSTHRKILMPMIRAKRGWLIQSGTPPEANECPDPHFFRNQWARAQDDPMWWGIHRDFTAHPSAEVRDEIAADREHTPQDEFDREYMALFPEEREHRLPMYQLWGPNQAVKGPEDVVDTVRHAAMRPHTGTGIDLADNENELGSKAAVITYRVFVGGIVFILAAEYYRNPSEVLDALFFHHRSYGVDRILLQKTAFDKGFRHTVEAASTTRGSLPVEMTNLGGSSKRRRILQMEPLARAGKIYVHEDLHDFRNEWEQFPDGLRESTKQRKRIRMVHDYDMLDGGSVLVLDAQSYQMSETVTEPGKNTAKALRLALRKKAQGVKGRDLQKYFQIGEV